jgi:hypothetical protein
MSFRDWSLGRVAFACSLWVVALVALEVLRALRFFRQTSAEGIGAVSFGLAETGVVLLGPPLVFVLVWFLMKRSAGGA